MKKCCLVECERKSLNSVSDYCQYHYRERNELSQHSVENQVKVFKAICAIDYFAEKECE